MYKYVLNSVAKISLMSAQYFEYYAIILRGRFFVDTLYISCFDVTISDLWAISFIQEYCMSQYC